MSKKKKPQKKTTTTSVQYSGFMRGIKTRITPSVIFLLLLCSIYVLLELVTISWGIPNESHPFTYHMDEWHFMSANLAILKHFTHNLPGSANGPMFYYITTIVWLAPFYFLHIINPFLITSSVTQLSVQQELFIILRLHTILSGVLGIFLLYLISKRVKINEYVATVLFVFTPIWICLSGYYKYDITLVTIILLSLYTLLPFSENPSRKNFFVASIACGLALATKVSGLPLLLSLIAAFFLFSKAKRNYQTLILGICIYFVIFIILGIPDLLLFSKSRLGFIDLLTNVIIDGSQGSLQLTTGNWGYYVFMVQYPLMFGVGVWVLGLFSFLYHIYKSYSYITAKKLSKIKNEFFLFITCIFFLLSLLTLRTAAVGNRTLVMLPFIVLLIGYTFRDLYTFFPNYKKIITFVIVACMGMQIVQTGAWWSVKITPDPRTKASQWIVKNIPYGSHIALENVPIYQMVPDIPLKEAYIQLGKKSLPTRYTYDIVTAQYGYIPKYAVISNGDIHITPTSEKSDLVTRLEKSGYKRIISFKPHSLFYDVYGDGKDFFIVGLIPSPTLVVYEK